MKKLKIQISNKLHLIYIGAMAAIMTLGMASCQQDDAMPTDDDNNALGELVQFNIGKPAGFISVGNDTRTVIADDGKVAWEDGDKVYVSMMIGADTRRGTLTYSSANGGSWSSNLRWPLGAENSADATFYAYYLGKGEGSGLGQNLFQHQIYCAGKNVTIENFTLPNVELVLAPYLDTYYYFNQFVFTGLTPDQTITLSGYWTGFVVDSEYFGAVAVPIFQAPTFTADANGQVIVYLNTEGNGQCFYQVDSEAAIDLRPTIDAAITAASDQAYGHRFIIACGTPAGGGTGAGDIEAAAAIRQEFLDWYNGGASTDFTLSGDIDLTGVTLTTIQDLPFGKTFNGAGYTITGLNINTTTDAGLFAENNGIIKNVIVKGATIVGGFVGAIAGTNYGTIVGCYGNGNTFTGDHAGGIAGLNTDTGIIVACHENGSTINGDALAGGIAGLNENATIMACYAKPTSVSCNVWTAGAIVSRNNGGNVVLCYYQHDSLEGIGSGTDTTTKSDLADCYETMNTALAGSAAAGVVSWGTTGLVYP